VTVPDPRWTITLDSLSPLSRQVADTLLTLGAGGFATRGLPEEATGEPGVLAAGGCNVTVPGEGPQPLPSWTGLDIDPAPAT